MKTTPRKTKKTKEWTKCGEVMTTTTMTETNVASQIIMVQRIEALPLIVMMMMVIVVVLVVTDLSTKSASEWGKQ